VEATIFTHWRWNLGSVEAAKRNFRHWRTNASLPDVLNLYTIPVIVEFILARMVKSHMRDSGETLQRKPVFIFDKANAFGETTHWGSVDHNLKHN